MWVTKVRYLHHSEFQKTPLKFRCPNQNNPIVVRNPMENRCQSVALSNLLDILPVMIQQLISILRVP